MEAYKILVCVVKYILKYCWIFKSPSALKIYFKVFWDPVCVIKYILTNDPPKIFICGTIVILYVHTLMYIPTLSPGHTFLTQKVNSSIKCVLYFRGPKIMFSLFIERLGTIQQISKTQDYSSYLNT